MKNQLTDEAISSVLAYIAENPKCSSGDLPGDQEIALLALRQLKLRGRIKGMFQADMTKIGNDQGGAYIGQAVGLELT